MSNKLPYAHFLLEHYHNPYNKKSPSHDGFCYTIRNPSCGDEVTLHGTCYEESKVRVYFEGKGCVISLAAASILATITDTKSINDIMQITAAKFVPELHIELGPNRLRCGLLCLEGLQTALTLYQEKNKNAQ